MNYLRHLLGLFYRSIQFLEAQIRPIWVFEGKSPSLKEKVREKRREAKVKAEEKKKESLEKGDIETAKSMVIVE